MLAGGGWLGGASAPARAGTFISVPGDGARLYVEISGKGPPIVFLHGSFSSFDRTYSRQQTYFSSFRTVIGIDQRGNGHSPDTDQPFSYEQMAQDTASVLQQLHLGPADVVGHSDGGNVGLILAFEHPELVRRLVVSGANFRGDINGLIAYARFRWGPLAHFINGQPASLRADYDRVSPDGDRHWPVMAAKTRELWTTFTVISPKALLAIRAPVLVMAGENDVIPLGHTLALYGNLSHGHLCILPNSGHETMSDQPDEFNLAVRRFLEDPLH